MNLSTPIPLSFKTRRLVIRRYRTSDEQALYDAARSSIAEVFEFLPWCHPDYKIEDSRDWLGGVEENWKSGSAYNFAIFNADESEFYGGCGLGQLDEHPVYNLGYWVKTASTGQGLATEATIGLARFGMQHLGAQRIEVIMSVENPGSRSVAVAAGAHFEGELRNRLHLHGRNHHAYLYSMTPDDNGR